MNDDRIKEAITIVREGGIVIYPTDTAFGIGCRIDDMQAVDRLFQIRRRPLTQPTPVLVSSIAMALPYLVSPTHVVRHLMETYWPGALTIVAPCQISKVYSPIRGGGRTIGVRQPDHPVAHALIAEVGVPILGPSANFHGEKTPYRFEDLDPALVKLVDMVVPGVCSVGEASTVVDCTREPYTILRQGAVQLRQTEL